MPMVPSAAPAAAAAGGERRAPRRGAQHRRCRRPYQHPTSRQHRGHQGQQHPAGRTWRVSARAGAGQRASGLSLLHDAGPVRSQFKDGIFLVRIEVPCMNPSHDTPASPCARHGWWTTRSLARSRLRTLLATALRRGAAWRGCQRNAGPWSRVAHAKRRRGAARHSHARHRRPGAGSRPGDAAAAPGAGVRHRHAEHALTAFELDAVDYLTKPVRLERCSRRYKKPSEQVNLHGASPSLTDNEAPSLPNGAAPNGS